MAGAGANGGPVSGSAHAGRRGATNEVIQAQLTVVAVAPAVELAATDRASMVTGRANVRPVSVDHLHLTRARRDDVRQPDAQFAVVRRAKAKQLTTGVGVAGVVCIGSATKLNLTLGANDKKKARVRGTFAAQTISGRNIHCNRVVKAVGRRWRAVAVDGINDASARFRVYVQTILRQPVSIDEALVDIATVYLDASRQPIIGILHQIK